MEVNPEHCRYLRNNGCQCPNPKRPEADFCDQPIQWAAADLEVFKAVTEHYRQDIREYWSRSNFYLPVEAGLWSVYATLGAQSSPKTEAMRFGLGLFGLAIAIVWALVSRGSVVWIRRWRGFAAEPALFHYNVKGVDS